MESAGYLQGGLRVRVQHVAAALGADALPAPPQHDVDLHIDQQGDDEGHVEGHDGGVHHEGRVGNDAFLLIWKRKPFRIVVPAEGTTTPAPLRL